MSSTPDWTIERDGATTLVAAHPPATASPARWRALLGEALRRHGPRVAIVAKRTTPEGSLTSMGEFVVHPKGLHSLGHGLQASAYRFPEEVDGAMSGVALFPNELVAGLAPPDGAFGLLGWCLEARLRGGRVVAIPEVQWVEAARPLAVSGAEIAAFVERFGFHPFAPDIDAIAANDRLAPLRWNVRFFGSTQPFDKYAERGAFHWTAYAEHEAFRQRADFLVRLAADVIGSAEGEVADIGCGDGLFAAKLAERGVAVVGVDNDRPAIVVAREEAGHLARFAEGSVYELPFADGSMRGAILLDVIEHLHNPARALRSVARVLGAGSALVVSTPEWQFGHSSDPLYHGCEFSTSELQRLLAAEGLFRIERTARIGGVYRDIVVVARRT